jgi:hypothetical protein
MLVIMPISLIGIMSALNAAFSASRMYQMGSTRQILDPHSAWNIVVLGNELVNPYDHLTSFTISISMYIAFLVLCGIMAERGRQFHAEDRAKNPKGHWYCCHV